MPPASAGRVLLLAVWSGLVAGLAEIALVQTALRADIQVRLSADYVWMASVANVAFAVTAVATVLAVCRLKGRDPTPPSLAVLGGLLVVMVAFYLESLHKGAVLLLAAGIGAQAARLARLRPARRLFSLVAPTAVVMAGLVGYFGLSLRRTESRREAAALAALPAPPTGAPNVLLLILDTVRRQAGLGASQVHSTTPGVDSFATRGVSFDRAIAPAPWTLPSHASFFTGRLPRELSASLAAPLDGRYPTLAEYLASKGYLTAGFVANLSFATRASGLARGFAHYEDYPVGVGQTLMSSSIGRALVGAGWLRRIVGWHELPSRRTARHIAADFLAWQRSHQDRPYFAFLNFFDAHEPYFPAGRSGSSLWPGPRWTRYEHVVGLFAGANAEVAEKWTLTPAEVETHSAAYFLAASRADLEASRLFGELDRRGALDNTLVIIAGDHGEQLGEHQRFGHLNSLYLPALHVPLIMVGPRVPSGTKVAGAVSLRDIPATVVEILGLSAGAPFPGRSLAGHWTGVGGADTVFAVLQGGYARQARYPIGAGREMFSLTTTAHHYIRNADGTDELYDLSADPGQGHNLAADPSHSDLLGRLRRHLDRILSETPPPS